MAKKHIHEVLEGAAKLGSQEARRQYLKDNYSVALITVLKGGFDDSVQWSLPDGEPPYRKDDAPKGFEPNSLHRLSSRFGKYFLKGGQGERLTQTKRESMFIEVLESLHPDEAELVLAMKDKKLTGRYKGVTLKLVQDTFPDLIKQKVVATKVKKEAIK